MSYMDLPRTHRLIDSTGAVFADGTSEPFDAIIAATGFTTGLGSLIDVSNFLDDRGEPLGTSGVAKRVRPNGCAGVAQRLL